MSLLKEFSGLKPVNTSHNLLKAADGSDAGKSDVVDKATNDIAFDSTRNTINTDGEITGSQVADYLEKAADINDGVDTVPFGLETDDGSVVKVYVNAEQADKFEAAMQKLLGMDDDIEEAINKLAQEFDIVDVVWPKDKTPTNDVSDETFDELEDDPEFDPLEDEDEMVEIGRFDPLEESLNEPNEDRELEAVRKLIPIVANLRMLGTAGVRAATGIVESNKTKYELITEYMNTEYAEECKLVRSWMSKSSTTLPFWLQA